LLPHLPFSPHSILRWSANRQIVIRQTAPASGPVRRAVRCGSISRSAWRFRSWFTVCSKPAYSDRRTDPSSLACLPPSGALRPAEAGLCCALQKAAVNRPTALRLSRHLRFAGPIRRSTTRVFRYCCGHRCRTVRLEFSFTFRRLIRLDQAISVGGRRQVAWSSRPPRCAARAHALLGAAGGGAVRLAATPPAPLRTGRPPAAQERGDSGCRPRAAGAGARRVRDAHLLLATVHAFHDPVRRTSGT
jgi:hypothetical protein